MLLLFKEFITYSLVYFWLEQVSCYFLHILNYQSATITLGLLSSWRATIGSNEKGNSQDIFFTSEQPNIFFDRMIFQGRAYYCII